MKENYVLISRVLAAAVMVAAALTEKAFPAGPPELPEVGTLLNLFRFDDTNWLSYRGYPPKAFGGIQLAPSWDTNAVRLTGPGPSYLSYNCVETNWTNISCSRGVIWTWFRPQWNSGTGPGTSARLFEVGAFSAEQTNWFALHFNPTGNKLYFSGHSNGFGGVYLESPPLQFVSNQWTLLTLTYTTTNSALYTNGVLATNGTGVLYPPSDSVLSNSAFYLGSDSSGSNVVNGDLEWVRIYKGLLPADIFLTHYNFGLSRILQYEGGGGDAPMGPGGEGFLGPEDGGGDSLMDGGDPSGPESATDPYLSMQISGNRVPFLQRLVDRDNVEGQTTPLLEAEGGYHGNYRNVSDNVSGSIINFYNVDDFALRTGQIGIPVHWEQHHYLNKPEGYPFDYGFDTATRKINRNGIEVTDPHEIRAMVSRTRSSAVGAHPGVLGSVDGDVDLKATFGFELPLSDHTAQCNRTIQSVRPYFVKLLDSFGIVR